MVATRKSAGFLPTLNQSDTGAKLALMSGSTLVKAFIGLPAGAQAVYTSSGLAYYRHGDPLGSSRFASTPSQTMYSDTAYAPFGEHYAPAGTTDLSFTGQNQDTASGVYDFPARELGEVSGRWPSPDPAGIAAVNPGDPQTWNRYAYVRNSPLNLTDPTGLILKSDPCGDGGCGGGDGYCPPWFAYCGDPCEIFGEECDDGGDDGGGGGGVPGLPPAAPPSFPLDTTNAWNEVNGLPAGYQLPQLSVWCLVSPACSSPSLIIENDQASNDALNNFYIFAQDFQDIWNWARMYAAFAYGPTVLVDMPVVSIIPGPAPPPFAIEGPAPPWTPPPVTETYKAVQSLGCLGGGDTTGFPPDPSDTLPTGPYGDPTGLGGIFTLLAGAARCLANLISGNNN